MTKKKKKKKKKRKSTGFVYGKRYSLGLYINKLAPIVCVSHIWVREGYLFRYP